MNVRSHIGTVNSLSSEAVGFSSGAICLVEDDPTIAELVPRHLGRRGYDVDVHDRAESVMAATKNWDLYILDILLAGSSTGLDLCRVLRRRSPTVPILILSALSEPADRIEGLKCGADDYLTKPFEIEELMLRVDGMLKRRSWYGKFPEDRSTFEWEAGRVDFSSFEGESRGERFAMSQKECMILKLLIEKEGSVVTRDEILDRVWGYSVYPSTRTVDNFILQLRKYFEPTPKNPWFIHSVRGVGYKFTSRGKDAS